MIGLKLGGLLCNFVWSFSLKKKKRFYLFIFRQGKGERKGGRETSMCGHMPPTGDQACNPGMCPDWELNQRPFGSQAGAQSTELLQAGLEFPWNVYHGTHFWRD